VLPHNNFWVLREYNSLLTRAVIREVNSLIESGQVGQVDTYEDLITIMIRLHGDPIALFLSSFAVELTEVRNLGSLMRERSVAVRVLQHIWQSFDLQEIVSNLLRFVGRFTIAKLKVFNEGGSQKEKDKLKAKMRNCISKLFTIEKIPVIIRTVCAYCACLVEAHHMIEKEDIVQWVVGSLIFLRFIIPSVTSLATDVNSSDPVKKGAVLMGRFLMKLCCKTQFGESQAFLNELLSEFAPLFDGFCEYVVASGATNMGIRAIDQESIENDRKLEVHQFLTTFVSGVVNSCEQMYIKEAKHFSTSFGPLFNSDQSNDDIRRQTQMSILSSAHLTLNEQQLADSENQTSTPKENGSIRSSRASTHRPVSMAYIPSPTNFTSDLLNLNLSTSIVTITPPPIQTARTGQKAINMDITMLVSEVLPHKYTEAGKFDDLVDRFNEQLTRTTVELNGGGDWLGENVENSAEENEAIEGDVRFETGAETSCINSGNTGKEE
jgi:hypothetical protein